MQTYELKDGIAHAEVFLRRLEHDLYSGLEPLEAKIAVSGRESVLFNKRLSLSYQNAEQGVCWGGAWDNAWFHLTGKLQPPPEGFSAVCIINTGGESLVYSPEGKALCGLTNYAWFENDFTKEEFFPTENNIADGKIDLWISVTANALAGIKRDRDPSYPTENKPYYDAAKFNRADAGLRNNGVYGLIRDCSVLLSLITNLEQTSYRRKQIVSALIKASVIYADNVWNANAARAALATELSRPAASSAMNVCAVGHAHIDTAFMWHSRESIKKCARTFSSQLELMDIDPEYVFGASQPQHYAWMKKFYPELYSRIKGRVAEGRWELQGGMWLEADCNIPSGESLIRQFLHGKNFFMDEFGINVKNLWLPDVFGYSPSLPQIIKKSLCTSFLTTKLSWNDANMFPYSSFRWCGIDGSKVTAHIPPEGLYSSFFMPDTLIKAQNTYPEADVFPEFISLFGIGDGGGGPNRDDLATAKRVRNLEGMPRIRLGKAEDFFKRLEDTKEELPVWQGELYLEKHRGTLTSHASIKRANRKNEELLSAVEFIYCCLPLAKYPAAELDRLWKLLLLNQFHDILPGSSIAEVYETARDDYEGIGLSCSKLLTEAAVLLMAKDDSKLTLMNSLSYTWQGWVMMPCGFCPIGNCARGLDGKNYAWIEIPPLSFTTLENSGIEPSCPTPEQAASTVLENELIRYTLDSDLQVISAYDKEFERELIPEGKNGNVLSYYRDYPNANEAWDIDRNYEKELIGNAVNSDAKLYIGNGSIKEVMANLEIGNSKIKQIVRLSENSRRLDFITEVEWHEKRKMMRVSFPTQSESANASFDIQYGFYERPAHRSNSWDAAKFEVMLHKYMDISDAGYGTALLNDCKYGGKIYDQALDLALLRSPRYPAPNTDHGSHTFTYSFLPHKDQLQHSDVMAQAAMLNRRPQLFIGYSCSRKAPFILEGSGIIAGSVKKAEKGSDLIIRLVETNGVYSKGRLIFENGLESIWETDMMEWCNGSPLNTIQNSLDFEMTPFEIKTLRLKYNNQR